MRYCTLTNPSTSSSPTRPRGAAGGDPMRFYNPGSTIQQMLPYTNTTKDPRDGSTISNYLLNAPERDFFELPDVITLLTIDGEATIPVGFSRIVKATFSQRGVVMINPRAKE